jgi:hypothetical protein
MSKKDDVRDMLMEVLNNQLKDNNPPITKKTLTRLINEGSSENDAKEMMLEVVWAEIFVIMEQQKPFNLQRYTNALEYLPKFLWDDK